MSNICIIPARGGSKRIPLKNIKSFIGKPIIGHTIQIAKKAKIFKRIIVSTDNLRISNIAIKFGAEVHLRSKNLAKDNVSTIDVINDVIKKNLKKSNFIKVCCIYPTSVFCTYKKLIEANKKLKKDINFVFSAVKYSYPIYRSFKKNKKGGVKMLFKKFEKYRTQNLPQFYHDAAQFYFGWNMSWLKKKSIFDKKSRFIEFDNMKVQDIDNPDDWKLALLKYKKLQKK